MKNIHKKLINYLIIHRLFTKQGYLKLARIILFSIIIGLCVHLGCLWIEKPTTFNLLIQNKYMIYGLIFCYSLLIALLVYFYRAIFPLSNIQEEQLRKLRFGFVEEIKIKDEKTGNPKIIKKYSPPFFLEDETTIRIGTISPEIIESDFDSRLLEQLSGVFKTTLISCIEKVSIGHQNVFTLLKYRAPIRVELKNDMPKKMKPFSLYLGNDYFTSEKYQIDLQEKAAVYIQGAPGSGKSVLLQSIIEQFFLLNPDYKIKVVTSKPNDFAHIRLLKRYRERIEVIELSPEINSFELNSKYICDLLISVNGLALELDDFVMKNEIFDPDDQKVSVLSKEYGFSSNLKYCFIFDEAADYTIREKSNSKSVSECIDKIIQSIDRHTRKNARFCSCPIFVCSQHEESDALDINMKSFTLRICSKVSTTAQSQALLQNGDALVKPFLKKGCFAFKTDKIRYVQTPYYKPERDNYESNIENDSELRGNYMIKNNLKRRWTLEQEDSYAITYRAEHDTYLRNHSIDKLSDEEFVDFVAHLRNINLQIEANKVANLRKELNLNKAVVSKDESNHSSEDTRQGLRSEAVEDIFINRTAPEKEKYQNTHEIVVVKKNGIEIFNKFLKIGLTDKEILEIINEDK